MIARYIFNFRVSIYRICLEMATSGRLATLYTIIENTNEPPNTSFSRNSPFPIPAISIV